MYTSIAILSDYGSASAEGSKLPTMIVLLVLTAIVCVIVFRLRGQAAADRKQVLARLAAERELIGADYSPTADLFREVGAPLPEDFSEVLAPPSPSPVPSNPDPSNPDPSILAPSGSAGPEIVTAVLPTEPTPAPVVESEAPPATAEMTAETTNDAEPLPASEPSAPPPVEPQPEVATQTQANTQTQTQTQKEAQPQAPARTAATTPPSSLGRVFSGISLPCGLRPAQPVEPQRAIFSTATPAEEVTASLANEFSRLGINAVWVDHTVAHVERNDARAIVTIHGDGNSTSVKMVAL